MKLTQQGFSLVSVLIAAAIMGLLATNFAMYMKNANDSQRGLESRGDAMALEQTLHLLLRNSTTCTAMMTASSAFYSPNASPAINNIDQLTSGSFSLTEGNNFSPNVNIISINFSAPTGIPVSATLGFTEYVADLEVRVATSNRVINLSIPLAITSDDSTGVISTCASGAAAVAAAGGTGPSGMTPDICNGIAGATWNGSSCIPGALSLTAATTLGTIPTGTILYVP
jgi:hypothetical protein